MRNTRHIAWHNFACRLTVKTLYTNYFCGTLPLKPCRLLGYSTIPNLFVRTTPQISRKLDEIQYGANATHKSSPFSDFSKLHRKLLRNVIVKQDISAAKIHSVVVNRCEIYFRLATEHIKSRYIPVSLNNNVFSVLSGRLSIN